MYNRYIPQPDGSFSRSKIPEESPHHPVISATQQTTQETPCKQSPKKSTPVTGYCRRCPHCRQQQNTVKGTSSTGISSLLKQLMPKDFDSGDLMVVLLLLLMSSECQEDQNTALLTLALYLFL